MRVEVRYFAAAAEAAGTTAESIELTEGETMQGLARVLADRHGPALHRVLEISSLLVDGRTRVASEESDEPLRSAPSVVDGEGGDDGGAHVVRVDVLPPFAGG